MGEATQALQKIAKGTGIIFIGTVISMLFQFLSRTAIARYFTISEYGIFSLALTLLNIALVVATLGFSSSLPREVAFYREKEPTKVADIITTALIVVVLSSLIWTILVFLGAERISGIFNDGYLGHALKILAFSLPFWALITVIISILRGFGSVKEQVYFQNIMFPTLFLVFVIIVGISKLPFSYVFVAYIIAQSLTFLLLLVTIWKSRVISFSFRMNTELTRALLMFSLPLLFSGILTYLMGWTDTLMIGYYKPPSYVGLYNAASPIAKLIPIFLTSASFIYVPIVTGLYAKEETRKMKRVYQIITKWMFLATFPIFAFVFLFPDVVINLTFGPKYMEASTALRILSLGMIFHIVLGLNGWTLIVIGKTFFNMAGDLIAVIANVILNIILIPTYGIEGAAIATTVSYFVAKLFKLLVLYKETGIHPFTFMYLKSLVAGFLGIWGISFVTTGTSLYDILTLLGFLFLYPIMLLVLKCVDEEDADMLSLLEKRLGIELARVKRL